MIRNKVEITSTSFDYDNRFAICASVNGMRMASATGEDEHPTNKNIAKALRGLANWVEKQPDVEYKPRIVEETVTSSGGGE